MSVELVLDEQRTATAIRDAWLARQKVRLTLSERCMVRTIVGRPTHVAVTGAFVTIDGWHVPTVEIKGVGKPTVGDVEAYAHAMQLLREDVGAPVKVTDGWRPPAGAS
jgi:hypothetical protein